MSSQGEERWSSETEDRLSTETGGQGSNTGEPNKRVWRQAVAGMAASYKKSPGERLLYNLRAENTKAIGSKELERSVEEEEMRSTSKTETRGCSAASAPPENNIGRQKVCLSILDHEKRLGALPFSSRKSSGEHPKQTRGGKRPETNQDAETALQQKLKNLGNEIPREWQGETRRKKLATPEINKTNLLPAHDNHARTLGAVPLSSSKDALKKSPTKASRLNFPCTTQERAQKNYAAHGRAEQVMISTESLCSFGNKSTPGDVSQEKMPSSTFESLQSFGEKSMSCEDGSIPNNLTETTVVISSQGQESDVPHQDMPSYTAGGETLVSATLVDDFENPDDKLELVAVAEKVSKGRLYIGKMSIHWGCVVIIVAAIIISVAVPLATNKPRSKQNNDQEEAPPKFPNGTCGGGKPGNRICMDGSCCSPFGWCGNSSDHCVDIIHEDHTLEDNTTATIGPIESYKICGGYYPDWIGTPKVRDIHPNYNLIYLFSARPNGATDGSVSFIPNYDIEEFKEDVQHERSINYRTFILSVGGFGHAFSIENRTFSETFLDSVSTIYDEMGGIDGLDWDMYSNGIEPSTEEMIWISLELKSRYQGFIITSTAVPYRKADKNFCHAAVTAGALDYCAPKFYGAPDLTTPSSVLSYVQDWVDLLGEQHVVIGLAIHYEENHFQTKELAIQTYNATKKEFPEVRGVFNWQISYDHLRKTGFSTAVCTV